MPFSKWIEKTGKHTPLNHKLKRAEFGTPQQPLQRLERVKTQPIQLASGPGPIGWEICGTGLKGRAITQVGGWLVRAVVTTLEEPKSICFMEGDILETLHFTYFHMVVRSCGSTSVGRHEITNRWQTYLTLTPHGYGMAEFSASHPQSTLEKKDFLPLLKREKKKTLTSLIYARSVSAR